MGHEPPGLESRLEQLASRLEAVERRLAALEGLTPAAVPLAAADTAASADALADGAPVTSFGGALALTGRSLLILAGAFVLRTLAETGVLPPALGAALGVLYGAAWLFFADRDAGAGASLSATFHGLTSAVIVFPLLVEATAKFKFLSPAASAAAILLVTLLGLAVAHRRDLANLAWIETLGAASAAMALAVATRAVVLFAVVLFLLAAAAFAAGWRRRWQGPGWTAVAILDGFLLLMATAVLVAPPEQAAQLVSPAALVALLLALAVVSFGAFIARTWRTGGTVLAGEIAQGAAAGVIGFGGALAVTHRAGVAATVTGIVGLLLAAAAYGASFTFIDRIAGRRGSFVFYTTAALAFTLLGAFSLWRGPLLSLAFSATALATAWTGSRRARETLSLHAAIYLVAAAAAAGMGGLAWGALLRPGGPDPALPITPALLVVVAVAAVFCWLPVASHGRTWGSLARGVKAAGMIVLLLGLDELAVALVAPHLARGEDGQVAGAAIAVLRTALLSVSAVVLALLGRTGRLREAAWLVYPLLVAGGLKLLFEDLRSGHPAALVLSFALYGGALILAPRLARRNA
jgi:hypothetical protein